MPSPAAVASRRRAVQLLLLGLAAAGAWRLWHFASTDAQDFTVYWVAAHRWVHGAFPYLVRPDDAGFVFKYPPWVLPFFLPYAWADLASSKASWFLVQLVCLIYSVRWTIRRASHPGAAILAAFLFWWIWLAHFSAGQFTIVLLAGALWAAGYPGIDARRAEARAGLLAFLLSSKVVSLVSLAGMWRRFRRPRAWLALGAALVAAHLLAWFYYPDLGALYRGWRATAASGGAELGAEVVRGTGNHGLTAGILTWLGVDARATQWDLLVSAALSLVLGLAWARASRGLRFHEAWAGWLALGVIVHPLAWHHSFVLAYPLAAFSLDRAWAHERRRWLVLSLLGIACIGLLIPQVVGKTWVKPFELAKNKSWGVLFCAWALAGAARERGGESHAV